MFDVYFYSFAKKPNSTKRPAETAREYRCMLKAKSSIFSPVIILEGMDNPAELNYCYIPVFGRYYFITDWTNDTALWYGACEEDTLATWRDYIGESSHYIMRASAEWDSTIADDLYPATTTRTITASSLNWPVSVSGAFISGYYIIGIVNSSSSAVGAVSYYAMTQAQFKTFREKLLDNNLEWMNIEDLGEFQTMDTLRAQFNPFQYVVSCQWLPFDLLAGYSLGALVTSLPFGWWELSGVGAFEIGNNALFGMTTTPAMPKHPQAFDRGVWLNSSKFSRYALHIFGNVIPLDPVLVGDVANLRVDLRVDLVTCGGTIRVSSAIDTAEPVRVFAEITFNAGVEIQLAQMAVNTLGLATTAISTAGGVAGALMRGDVGGAITGGAVGVANTLDASFPQMSTTGSNGSVSMYDHPAKLQGVFYHVADEELAHRGRPLMSERQIKSIPGYIVCLDGEIDFPGTLGELDKVQSYLEGGFFFE